MLLLPFLIACILALVCLDAGIWLAIKPNIRTRLLGILLIAVPFLFSYWIYAYTKHEGMAMRSLSGTYEGLYGKFVMKPDGFCDQTVVINGATYKSHSRWRLTKRESVWYESIWWMPGSMPDKEAAAFPVSGGVGTLAKRSFDLR